MYINNLWTTCVTQSVKHLTLDFSSGHNLMGHEIKPHTGILSLFSLCPSPHLHPLSLSKYINIFKK